MALADGGTLRRNPSKVGTPYPAPSDDGWSGSWSGLYLGLGAGTLTGLGSIQHDEGSFLESLGGWGWQGNIRVGYDYRIPSSPFVLGLFGDYGMGEASVSAYGDEIGSLRPTWGAGGRFGLVAWNSSLLYLGYKYQRADLSILGDESRDIGGHSLLAGIEVPITKSLTLAIEPSYTRMDDVSLGEGLRLEPEIFAIMARANLRWGMGE